MRLIRFMAAQRRTGWLMGFLLAALVCAAQRKEDERHPLLSPAESRREGLALVAELMARRPAENSTNTGTVRIRNANGAKVETKVSFVVYATQTNWVSIYETRPVDHPDRAERLTVIHHSGAPNEYLLVRPDAAGANPAPVTLRGEQLMTPFAGSDFWVADLGLEFLHWPEPRVLKKDMRHSRAAEVLEARNPHPTPEGYSRVVAWLDEETGGVLHADAYDAKDKVIKEFDPTSVKNHELAEMEMRNRHADSTTWIKFDVEGK